VAASADQLATQAAMNAFAKGGTAVDAALAANAALAVTSPHLCGMGGDLFAIVHTPAGEVIGLNASGRAASGSDAAELRGEGHTEMPLRHDLRTVTVPGCVDGWQLLHDRFGTLALEDVLAPAIALAARGFPASPLLVGALDAVDDRARIQLAELVGQASAPGALVRRPGVALTLQAIARGGRDAFYDGAFGEGLVMLRSGLFTDADVLDAHAEWVDVLRRPVFDAELCTIGPNSQGYLALGIATLAEAVGLPDDPDDVEWAHVLVEATKAASHDRPAVLHEHADGDALLDDIATRAGTIDRSRASSRPAGGRAGDTTYLCTADDSGFAVSLIQSNAAGFGSWIVEPTTGINLHNRGLGFNLEPGHPAELAPGRRPPHTLLPAMAVRGGRLAAVLGTMGGDAQPQVAAQLATRILRHGADPADAVAAPRWSLRGPSTGFDTWTSATPPTVAVEAGAPAGWLEQLADRGHHAVSAPFGDVGFGHAHIITVEPDGSFAAAADPRTRVGSAAGV
jgi:gamma-glutamyltranspeptidase/glutathione hydrolase